MLKDHTTALILHYTKTTHKILQSRLQQWTLEGQPDQQAEFRRGVYDLIANI